MEKTAAAALALLVLAACAAAAAGQQASGVTAVPNSYAASLAFWDLWAVRAYCGEASCGRCLLVTNAATGAQATVRILDQCSFGGLGLDPFVFNQLDTEGHGTVTGQLTVSYQFVDCQD